MKKFFLMFLTAIFAVVGLCALAACGKEGETDVDETETVTVTFDVNGGNALANASAETERGGTVTLPVPERDGYEFIGWFFGKESGAQQATNATAYAQNVTLYAQWEEIAAVLVKVTFDVNGGNALANASAETEQGGTVTLPVPERDGYEFIGWFFGKESGAQQATNATAYSQNVTLYAQWEEIVTIVSIAVSGLSETYVEGEVLPFDSLIVTATYSDDSEKPLTYSETERQDGYFASVCQFNAAGVYLVSFYSYARDRSGVPCDYYAEVLVLHDYVETAGGVAVCSRCGAKIYAAETSDVISAGAWSTSVTLRTDDGSPARLVYGNTANTVSYGAITAGESVTIKGKVTDADTTYTWNTPLVGIKDVSSADGVMVRMDGWIMNGPDSMIRPEGSYAAEENGYNAFSGEATQNTDAWKTFLSSQSRVWDAVEIYRADFFTVTWYYRADGVMEILELLFRDDQAYQMLDYTLRVPDGAYQLIMYGESCTYEIDEWARTEGKGVKTLEVLYTGENMLLQGESFPLNDLSEITAEFYNGKNGALSLSLVSVWGTYEGISYDLRMNPVLAGMEICVVYGAAEAALQVSVVEKFFDINATGDIYLDAGGTVTLTVTGGRVNEVSSLSFGGTAKELSQWSDGDKAGALTLNGIERDGSYIQLTFRVDPLSFSDAENVAGRYVIEFHNANGSTLGSYTVQYSPELSKDGANAFYTLQNNYFLKIEDDRLYLFAYDCDDEGMVERIRFSGTADESDRVYALGVRAWYDESSVGYKATPAAINALTSKDAVFCYGRTFFGVYADLTAVGIRTGNKDETFYFELIRDEGYLVFCVEGGAVTYIPIVNPTQVVIREPNCGVAGLICYQSGQTGGFYFGYSSVSVTGEHVWVDGEDGHRHCSVCNAEKITVTVGSTVYETVTPPAYAIENTDYNDNWYNEYCGLYGSPVGRDVIGFCRYYGDFVIEFSWENQRDVNYQDAYAQMCIYDSAVSDWAFWTMEYSGGSGSLFDASNTTQVYTKTTTDGTTQTSSAPFLVWGKEGEFEGHYVLTLFRVGAYLKAELVFTHSDGTVYTQTFTTQFFTTEEVMVFVAGNPYYLDNFTFTYGTVEQAEANGT